MVRDNVRVTEQAVRNMHELMHGSKRQARLMVLPSLDAAQSAINLMNSGVSFGDVAVEMSIDSSAARGGLIEPISNADPTYPESIRQTLWTLNPGEVSGPVLIDDRYAVVMLVKRIAASGVKVEDAKPALERMVRIQQERVLMDQLARKLLSETQVTVFDDALHESWSKRGRGVQ
jgi:parvulin-like peptidyl-prolyl isomerase